MRCADQADRLNSASVSASSHFSCWAFQNGKMVMKSGQPARLGKGVVVALVLQFNAASASLVEDKHIARLDVARLTTPDRRMNSCSPLTRTCFRR